MGHEDKRKRSADDDPSIFFTPPVARPATPAVPPLAKPWTTTRSPALATRAPPPFSAYNKRGGDPAGDDSTMDRTIGETVTINNGLRHRDSSFAPPWGSPNGPNTTPLPGPPPSMVSKRALSQQGYPSVFQGPGGTERRWGPVAGAGLRLGGGRSAEAATATDRGGGREAQCTAYGDDKTAGVVDYGRCGDGVSSASFRVQQHVDQFAEGNGVSRLEGRRFTQLLQVKKRTCIVVGL